MMVERKSVFLADDDSDDREMFEDALNEISDKRIRLTQASDGRQLMEILEEKVPPSPDVIFLDLNMPFKNGFECLDQIRKTKKLQRIPVVIYSTSSEKEFIDRVYQQGADLYVRKPESFPLLKQTILRVLSIDWQNQLQQCSRDNFVLA